MLSPTESACHASRCARSDWKRGFRRVLSWPKDLCRRRIIGSNRNIDVHDLRRQGGVGLSLDSKMRGVNHLVRASAPEGHFLGRTASTRSLEPSVSLESDDIVTKTHSPQVVSVGIPFFSYGPQSARQLPATWQNVSSRTKKGALNFRSASSEGLESLAWIRDPDPCGITPATRVL